MLYEYFTIMNRPAKQSKIPINVFKLIFWLKRKNANISVITAFKLTIKWVYPTLGQVSIDFKNKYLIKQRKQKVSCESLNF